MKKILLAAIALMLFQAATVLAADCPAYLSGEYRQLHSSKQIDLCALTQNKVVLVVNTASHCGYTKQFTGLEALHQRFKDQDVVIVGFSSNDFNQEAKDESEAATVCFENFGVTFTMLAPTSVKGEAANPLFKEMANQAQSPSWNFNKYLLGRDGKLIEHFGSKTSPTSKKLIKAIETALGD